MTTPQAVRRYRVTAEKARVRVAPNAKAQSIGVRERDAEVEGRPVGDGAWLLLTSGGYMAAKDTDEVREMSLSQTPLSAVLRDLAARYSYDHRLSERLIGIAERYDDVRAQHVDETATAMRLIAHQGAQLALLSEHLHALSERAHALETRLAQIELAKDASH